MDKNITYLLLLRLTVLIRFFLISCYHAIQSANIRITDRGYSSNYMQKALNSTCVAHLSRTLIASVVLKLAVYCNVVPLVLNFVCEFKNAVAYLNMKINIFTHFVYTPRS